MCYTGLMGSQAAAQAQQALASGPASLQRQQQALGMGSAPVDLDDAFSWLDDLEEVDEDDAVLGLHGPAGAVANASAGDSAESSQIKMESGELETLETPSRLCFR